jgi:hypothetical protein
VGGGMGMKWKKPFSPKTRKMRPRRKRAMTEVIFIGSVPLFDLKYIDINIMLVNK